MLAELAAGTAVAATRVERALPRRRQMTQCVSLPHEIHQQVEQPSALSTFSLAMSSSALKI